MEAYGLRLVSLRSSVPLCARGAKSGPIQGYSPARSRYLQQGGDHLGVDRRCPWIAEPGRRGGSYRGRNRRLNVHKGFARPDSPAPGPQRSAPSRKPLRYCLQKSAPGPGANRSRPPDRLLKPCRLRSFLSCTRRAGKYSETFSGPNRRQVSSAPSAVIANARTQIGTLEAFLRNGQSSPLLLVEGGLAAPLADAALTNTSLLMSATTAWALVDSAVSPVSHQSRAWVSSSSRTY